MAERNDVGHVTYAGENTGIAPTMDCEGACDQHYVVRLDGTWVRAFHNEADARMFAEDVRDVVNMPTTMVGL